jgi:hypothetical protein
MKNKNHSSTGKTNSKVQDGSGQSGTNPTPRPADSKSAPEPARASEFRISGRDYVNPVDYQHPYESMGRFADFLALRYDASRTRHAYYRQVRLIHEYFRCHRVGG